MLPHTPRSTLFPYTTLFRSEQRILIQAETKSLHDSRPVDVSLNVYMCLDSHNSFNSEAASLVTVQRGRQRIEDYGWFHKAVWSCDQVRRTDRQRRLFDLVGA